VTRHASGRPRPGLGGTGRIADDLWLIAHHEVSGRAHLQPRALGLGLAGGLLAELLLDDAITITASMITAGPARPGDQLTAQVAARIAAEGQVYPVRDWLAFLGRTAASEVAARLAAGGYLTPVPRRPWRAARWVPADPDCAFAPMARIKAALDPSRPVAVTGVVLAALAAACGLGARLGLYKVLPGPRVFDLVVAAVLLPSGCGWR
jgi:hypothetical protein